MLVYRRIIRLKHVFPATCTMGYKYWSARTPASATINSRTPFTVSTRAPLGMASHRVHHKEDMDSTKWCRNVELNRLHTNSPNVSPSWRAQDQSLSNSKTWQHESKLRLHNDWRRIVAFHDTSILELEVTQPGSKFGDLLQGDSQVTVGFNTEMKEFWIWGTSMTKRKPPFPQAEDLSNCRSTWPGPLHNGGHTHLSSDRWKGVICPW